MLLLVVREGFRSGWELDLSGQEAMLSARERLLRARGRRLVEYRWFRTQGLQSLGSQVTDV